MNFRSPLSFVFEFLDPRHVDGHYSTIDVYRLMFSSTLQHVDGPPIGKHPLVKSLLSGCYNIHPPNQNKIPLGILVWWFASCLGSNYQLSKKVLSFKTVTLIALGSTLRTSGLSIESILRAGCCATE